MSVKKIEMFTIICDGCGKDVNSDTAWSCWSDVENNEEIRQEEGWEKIGDKHYCTDCFEIDDNDEIVLLKSN